MASNKKACYVLTKQAFTSFSDRDHIHLQCAGDRV